MPHRNPSAASRPRRGSFTILAVMFLAIFLVMAAMTVDIGYLVMSKAELQRTADVAVLAACWSYAVEAFESRDSQETRDHAAAQAGRIASSNRVCAAAPSLASSDVQWGLILNLCDANATLDTSAPLDATNAVSVLVRRSDSLNGRVPGYFARFLGLPGFSTTASSTAAIVRNVRRFKIPADGSNLGMLPLALDQPTWVDVLDGGGSDNWRYDPTTKAITSGSDGMREVNLYPLRTGAPGNRGTVDNGSSTNNSADLSGQIRHGVSPSDLNHIGSELKLNNNGELFLNGDTGIRAGIKDDLASIKGAPRVIPIFREVLGPGNNATYTIVGSAGVRIMNEQLTGSKSSKQVIIQPALMISKSVIPSTEYTEKSQ